MTATPSLLFYCQHSVGMGHLVRSLALVNALTARFSVTFVSGGAIPRGVRVPPGVTWVQLPPVGMAQDGTLVSHDRRRRLDRVLRARQRLLLDAFRAERPRVVVVELFPFGRRKFAGELQPMLDEARKGPDRARVYCSLRDILVSRDPAHDEKAAKVLNASFDGVIVHSDPSFARLEEGFSGRIERRVSVYYSGFVHAQRGSSPRSQVRPGSIVVSAGGGIVGEPLLRCAIAAHAAIPLHERPRLTLVAGHFLPDDAWRALKTETAGRERIELRRSVRDLASVLDGASGSISQCGYNTAMDVIASRVPALVVPFGEGSEDEQLKRARKLESLDLVRVVLPSELTPGRLADEMRTLSRFRPAAAGLPLNGADRTARILRRLCDRRDAPSSPDEKRSVA